MSDAKVKPEIRTIPDYYGENTFSLKVMRNYLSEKAFKSLSATIKERGRLDSGIADEVADAMKSWAVAAALSAFVPGPLLAADELAKDLTSTIALLGLPCGQVVSAQRLKDNDYIATCSNKIRYHVFINADGRVVAQKQ